MPYPIDEKLVIAIASSALFDLTKSDAVYRKEGSSKYRKYQRKREDNPLRPGIAFPLVKALLGLNGDDEDNRPIEVILLSRNDPDTGLRVLNSIEHHSLDISRAAFLSGGDPHRYIDAFDASLFLTANEADVRKAIASGAPAGLVMDSESNFTEDGHELRIAFDFDGVLGDGSSEQIFQRKGLEAFKENERSNADVPVTKGPLFRFFSDIANLQKAERQRQAEDPEYRPRIRIAIVTARNAPSDKRVVTSLREWDIHVDEVFFLGGVDKSRVLREFNPHIFFDDQEIHTDDVSTVAPSVLIPTRLITESN